MVVHVTQNSGNNSWYTPPHLVDCVRAALGGTIDLDPASSDKANTIVKAGWYYTEADDGLSQSWEADSVYLNPPYSRGCVKAFMEKMVSEFRIGSFPHGIALVNNGTETGWFQDAVGYCSAMCLPRGRVKYLTADLSKSNSPLQGQAILYFGDRPDLFETAFDSIGVVMLHFSRRTV